MTVLVLCGGGVQISWLHAKAYDLSHSSAVSAWALLKQFEILVVRRFISRKKNVRRCADFHVVRIWNRGRVCDRLVEVKLIHLRELLYDQCHVCHGAQRKADLRERCLSSVQAVCDVDCSFPDRQQRTANIVHHWVESPSHRPQREWYTQRRSVCKTILEPKTDSLNRTKASDRQSSTRERCEIAINKLTK